VCANYLHLAQVTTISIPTLSYLTDPLPCLPPNQQHQQTECARSTQQANEEPNKL